MATIAKKTNLDMLNGPLGSKILRFAIPIALSSIFQQMFNLADIAVVGRFAGDKALAAVGANTFVINLLINLFVGISVGANVVVANSIGEHSYRSVTRSVHTSVMVSFFSGIILSFVGIFFARPILSLISTPSDILDDAVLYLQVYFVGMPFAMIYNFIAAILRGKGDTKRPLYVLMFAGAFNVALNLILVAGFGMGAAGAAIATISAQAISVLFSFYFISKKNLPFVFSKTYIRFDPDCLKKILLVGVPIALQELLVQFSFLFIQVVVNSMGVMESAAVGVAEKVCVFLMLVASAYMQSISAFVAQNNGAGEFERSRKALFYGIKTALAAGFVMGSIAFFAGDLLSSVFSGEAEVIAFAHDYLKAYAIDCLLTAVLFCFIGYFNGCGKTVFVMLQGVFGAFCVRIPAVYLMSRMEEVSLFHIGLGTPISSVAQIILCVAAYRIYSKARSGS